MSPSDESLMDDIVTEAEEDWIEFSDAISVAAIVEGGDTRPPDRLARVAPLVVELVRRGRLVAGEHGTRAGPFDPWPVGAEAAARRVEAELVPYLGAGTVPLPGEICWFTTPDDPDLARRVDRSS